MSWGGGDLLWVDLALGSSFELHESVYPYPSQDLGHFQPLSLNKLSDLFSPLFLQTLTMHILAL